MASQVEHIKWVANRFMVDGFGFTNSRCKHYFLTHFHSDHTVGLTRGFHGGIIYCTQVTKNLLLKDFKLTPSCQIEVLEYEQPMTVQGVQVTAIPANHCPGSCMLLFEVPADAHRAAEAEVILHTGDFRWQSYMMQSSALKRLKVNTLYLDTTYALPRFRLPPQEQCILAMVEQMQAALKEQPATLFVIAAYRIGKEKVFLTAARLLGCKVWVSPAKRGVLQLLDLSAEDLALLADSPEQAQVHVVSWGLKPESLQQYLSNGAAGEEAAQQEGGSEAEAMQGAGLEQELEAVEEEGLFGQEPGAASVGLELPAALSDGEDAALTLPPPGSEAKGQQWKQVIGIRATGWTLRKGGKLHVWKQGPIALMSVPYSEHSSWDELCDCVRSLRPKKLVPTVNVETPTKFKAMLDKFAPLMDLSQDKSRIHFYMRSPHTLQALGVGARAGPVAEQGEGPEPQPEAWCRTSHREAIDLTPSGSSREDSCEGGGRPCDAPVSGLRDCKEEHEEEEEVLANDRVPGSVRLGTRDRAACTVTAAAGSSGLPVAGIDLSLIDVQEQVRIYASIVGQRALSCTQASAAGCRVQVQGGAAAVGSQVGRKRKPAAKQQQGQQQRQEGQKQGLEHARKRQACKPLDSAVQSDPEGKAPRQHGIRAFFSSQSIKP